MQSNLYFFFVACVLGVISKKPLPNLRFWKYTPTSSSRSFKCLALTSRSFWGRSSTSPSYMHMCLITILCWKDYSIPHWTGLAPLLKIINLQVCFWTPLLFHWSLSILILAPHFLYSKFLNQEISVFQLCSFSEVFWLLWVPYISVWLLGSTWQFWREKRHLGFW